MRTDPGCLPARYRGLALSCGALLAVCGATRLALAGLAWSRGELPLSAIGPALAVGSLGDLLPAAWLALLLAVLALVFPDTRRGRRAHAAVAVVALPVLFAASLFVAVAEWLFWNEFSARFNFIAVDYLVYTNEVLGNIAESYPVGPIVTGIVGTTLLVAGRVGARCARLAGGPAGGWERRLAVVAACALSAAVGSSAWLPRPGDLFRDGYAQELAGNGYAEFVRAFRSNDLDYFRFYPLADPARVVATLEDELSAPGRPARYDPVARAVVRRETPARGARRLHVVLVSIESLGADYVGALGDRRGLTPNLDRYARDGLLFGNLYATGLRTVRGLEAITLSVPPTPGHAVPMRPRHAAGLASLGGVLREHGWEALYLYGGDSRFDNMRAFFGAHGYTVIDRRAIARGRVSQETIWGVADEDVFALALEAIDARARAGRPVFAHVMTTSNHRPYTYPAGRVALPPGSGRDGAVQYTDYAIGRLIEGARRYPWFDDTLFVLVADHTSHGRGRTDLPPEHYHIPLVVYAPKHVAPARVDVLASQIDVAPTVLGLLGVDYENRFLGRDVLRDGARRPRAFLANYQTVGYLEDGAVVELRPRRAPRVVDAATGEPLPGSDPRVPRLILEAVSWYEGASAVVSGRDLPRPAGGAASAISAPAAAAPSPPAAARCRTR